MWTEEELPDEDYASLYGHAAMRARLLATLDAILRRQEEDIQRWAARRTARDQRDTQAPNSQ
jgi:hypothetical protein